MRWLYHVTFRVRASINPYTVDSLYKEGFIHASYASSVAESARLYFPAGSDLVVLQIDPRKLGVPLEVAETPRGPMPHIYGPIPREAIVSIREVAEAPDLPDAI